MRILLLGGGGRLGRALRPALAALGEVDAPGREALNLAEGATIAERVQLRRPDLIVNAAAYTAVDRAEAEPEAAQALNAAAPSALAEAAAALDVPLVHYSTDQVFDGSASQPYSEHDPASPPNAYGRSKWAGEEAVRRHVRRHLILRTTWLHSPDGPSFARLVLQKAREDRPLAVVDDEVGCPTPAAWLAEATVEMLRALRRDDARWGTWHAVASGAVSRFEYAAFVLAQAEARGWPLRQRATDLRRVRSTDFLAAAARPLNARLDNRGLLRAFGIVPPTWQAGVAALLDAWGGPS